MEEAFNELTDRRLSIEEIPCCANSNSLNGELEPGLVEAPKNR